MHRWLIAIAYWLAGGFIKSGLGNRIAYSMVAAFGKTTLGLTYSLVSVGEQCVHCVHHTWHETLVQLVFPPLALTIARSHSSDPPANPVLWAVRAHKHVHVHVYIFRLPPPLPTHL